jgi:hypothetical protein
MAGDEQAEESGRVVRWAAFGFVALAVSGKIGQRNLSWMTDENDANAT